MDGRVGSRSFPPAAAAVLVAASVLSACATLPMAPQIGDADSPDGLSPVYGWIGSYGGWGEVTTGGATTSVTDLELRIAFDADSVARGDCPQCVTVTLNPWFSYANLDLQLGDGAFFAYVRDGITHSLRINRFSGGGATANALLVQLKQERPVPGGIETLVNGDFEFRAR